MPSVNLAVSTPLVSILYGNTFPLLFTPPSYPPFSYNELLIACLQEASYHALNQSDSTGGQACRMAQHRARLDSQAHPPQHQTTR